MFQKHKLYYIYKIKIVIMKHLLNNLSEEEKNNIRKQHKGGIKPVLENFNKFLSHKLGTVNPLISEQVFPPPTEDDMEDYSVETEETTNKFVDSEGFEIFPIMKLRLSNKSGQTQTILIDLFGVRKEAGSCLFKFKLRGADREFVGEWSWNKPNEFKTSLGIGVPTEYGMSVFKQLCGDEEYASISKPSSDTYA